MRISRTLSIALAALVSIGLVGCSNAGSSADSAPDATADTANTFPVTIDHAFGQTVIEKKPERVASVAWANHEVPIAMGIVPVGMAKVTWGDDDGNGVLPWVEDALSDLGVDTSKLGDEAAEKAGEVPMLFEESDGIDFEAVADSKPDVILAAYSGITKEDYETLSKIARVVAYPDTPWATPLDEVIRMNAAALGAKQEGEELVNKLDGEITTAFDAHQKLVGAKVLFAYIDPSDLSQVGYYTAADPRTGFLFQHGMAAPQEVANNSDSEEFYLSVSAENADVFNDVDLIVTYGDDSLLKALQADPLLSKIPAVAEGRVAVLADNTPLAASAIVSPLSIAWGLEEYFDLLEAPLRNQ